MIFHYNVINSVSLFVPYYQKNDILITLYTSWISKSFVDHLGI